MKDETGEPVIGATVMEKGTTTNGVVTDFDGNYTIEIPADGMLAVSYIGCKDQDINWFSTNQLKKKLEEL